MNSKYVMANNGSSHVKDSIKIQETRLSNGPYGNSAPRNLSVREQPDNDQQLP